MEHKFPYVWDVFILMAAAYLALQIVIGVIREVGW